MKICVLGAGVNGVSTAFALARAGHEVHVIDQAASVARGASEANGAQLSYSHVEPFAGPSTLALLPSYLSGRDPAVKLGISLSKNYVMWGLKFLRECSTARAQANLATRVKLALRSRATLQSFAEDCSANALTPASQGKIILASTDAQMEHLRIGARRKRDLGLDVVALTRDACLARETALKDWQSDFTGGIYAKGDMALDPVKFCEALQSAAVEKYGAVFHFSQTIQKIETEAGKVCAVQTDHQRYECDRIILCLGNSSNSLLNGLGLKEAIYPMQGYSLTLPTQELRIVGSLTALKQKIVFANLGEKIRIAGFMDANQIPENATNRLEQLRDLARRLWPTIADYDAEPNFWTHYRPMTPSGVPIIKESDISGLFLNIGHGSLGYTFAPGSAMLITEMIGSGDNLWQHPYERKQYA